VLPGLLAGVAVLVAVARLRFGLADGVTGFGALALPDPALVEPVVLERGEVHDLDRDADVVAATRAEFSILDELREVLPALLADLPEPIQVVFQSYL
jgi:hypothetical protein